MSRSSWIDAKRWPDKIGTYIVNLAGNVGIAVYMGGGLWQADGQVRTVTHWQPFPDPPEVTK